GARTASSATPAQDDSKATKSPTTTDSHADRREIVRKPRTGDFKAAWDAVASKSLTFSERMRLQRDLLEKWAEVDLQGALDAAMAEAWDNDYNPGFEMLGTSGNLYIEAFRKAFADRPLDSWALISSGRYGVGTEILRKQWITSVAAIDGPMVLSVIGDMPNGTSAKEFAVEEAMRSAATNPDRQAAVLAKLLELPADEQTERWIQKSSAYLPTDGDPAALRGEWTALPAGTQRTLAIMKWAASLKMADDAALRDEWSHVPVEGRAGAVDALLSSTSYDTKSLLTILDLTMEAGQWTKLSKEGHEKLIFNSAGIEPVKLAEWAVKLPEREETVELFHRSVDRYISEDMPRAKEWLEQMEPGDWHRERGLAEYSQQALRSHNDPEASRWALDQISDPALKEKAEGWRRDWERENGRAN
ncbi:MAG TPA: hypothetical protein VGE67_15565, partial [Haloferula sp.]